MGSTQPHEQLQVPCGETYALRIVAYAVQLIGIAGTCTKLSSYTPVTSCTIPPSNPKPIASDLH